MVCHSLLVVATIRSMESSKFPWWFFLVYLPNQTDKMSHFGLSDHSSEYDVRGLYQMLSHKWNEFINHRHISQYARIENTVAGSKVGRDREFRFRCL